MMLVRSIPTSIDDHGKQQESSCVWLLGDESWQQQQQEPTKKTPFPVTKHNNNSSQGNPPPPPPLWSRNNSSSSSSSLSSSTEIINVYKRRMNVLPPTLVVYKRRKVQRDDDDSKSGSADLTKKQRSGGLNINDTCSSSKSNIDLGSAFVKQVDDDAAAAGECSSSTGGGCCFLKPCKVCDQLEKTLEIINCHLCEESFHMSCCNPVLNKLPVGDWFCNSCSTTKPKKKMDTISTKLPQTCLGPSTLLTDSNPFTSNVRIGEDFQAQIPDWSGPLTDELNGYLEPMEVSPLECASYQEWDVRKLSRLGSIGNWLQCREVVDGVDGSVCGKWRRAPLFEAQTDKWECFSSFLWDPTHADCAVPQELDTEQVLRQLKYIEMLMPRLSAKRWKLGVSKRADHPKNTQRS